MHDELAQQERQILFSLLSVKATKVSAPAELERRRKLHVDAYSRFKSNEAAQIKLKRDDRFRPYHFPLTPGYKRLSALEQVGRDLFAENMAAAKQYDKQARLVKSMQSAKEFVLSFDPGPFTAPLNNAAKAVSESLSLNWLGSVIVKSPATHREYLPKALVIVIAVILMPVLIKAALYYLFAPLTSRRKAIALLPERAGEIEDLGTLEGQSAKPHSSVSRSIVIDQSHELLVPPE